MVSADSKRRKEDIKARGQRNRAGIVPEPAAPATACTGDLADADKCYKDIKIRNLNLSIKGEDLIRNSTLNLTFGSFYGIVPSAASDVCSLFKAMAEGLLPFPSHFEVSYPVYNPDRGQLSVLEYVASREDVVEQIEAQQANLAIHAGNSEAMRCLNKRMKAFGKYGEEYAAQILYSLGFDKEMQSKTADGLPISWQKPLALARTLHIRPQIMLIDEPTHILDLERSLWLAEYILKNLKEKCIVIIKSNDKDFLSELLCTEFVHLKDREVQQFSGNYDAFVLSKAAIPSANLVLEEPLNRNLTPPYLQLADASFRYDDDQNLIFEKVKLDLTSSSKIALVGSKGSGKSTLLKILMGATNPTLTEGRRTCHPSLSIGYFHPQLIEELNLSLSPMEHVSKVSQGRRIKNVVTGLQQTDMRKPIRNLSYGQKTLLVLACISLKQPDILLVDEPCENLDVETISSIGNALKNWSGSFVLATSNLTLIKMLSCTVWFCGSRGLTNYPGDIMHLKQQVQEHNTKMANIRNPAKIRSIYPQFSITNFADVAHPLVHYEEYIDEFSLRFKSGCIPFSDFIEKMAMVANAPSTGLDKGEMDFPYETNPTETYRMTTDPGRRVCRSLLGAIHFAEEAGECFSDFDSNNLVVTSTGTVRIKGVKRKKLCLNQLRRNHMSAHKIILDMCSAGGALPEDIKLLLDMIETEPDMAPLYHIHYSVIPICALSPFFTKMFEQLLRYIKDDAVVEQILLEMPYLGTDPELIKGQSSGVWHHLANTNKIIKKTYSHTPGLYNKKPLKVLPFNVAITPQQIRKRKIKEARNLLNCLRNRTAHRMDYNDGAFKYTARASDLATHARYSKLGCVLQKELHKAKQTDKLDLHEFSLEKV